MAMSIYMSKIACDDLHLAIVKKYSDSDSPFGHVDVFSLGAALKSALEVECGRTNISSIPKLKLPAVLRRFVGDDACAYEREVCSLLSQRFEASGDAVDGAALTREFGSTLDASLHGSSSLLSKVDLRHAVVAWLAPNAAATSTSPAAAIAADGTSPSWYRATADGTAVRKDSKDRATPPSPATSSFAAAARSPPAAVSEFRAAPWAAPPPLPRTSPPITRPPPLSSPPHTSSALSSYAPPSYAPTSTFSALGRYGGPPPPSAASYSGSYSHASPPSGAPTAARTAVSAVVALLSQAEEAARHAERQAEAADGAHRAAHEAATALQTEKTSLASERDSLQAEVTTLKRQLDAAARQSEHDAAAAAAKLAAADDATRRLEEDLARARSEYATLHAALYAERESAAAAARDAAAQAHAEAEATRVELTSRLKAAAEQAEALHAEKTKLLQTLEHADGMHQAAAARLESKLAAAVSQGHLELERVRERAVHDVASAREEIVRARAEVLQAREDALEWQRKAAP